MALSVGYHMWVCFGSFWNRLISYTFFFIFCIISPKHENEITFFVWYNFNYIVLDLFEESEENKNEVIPNTTFSSNPIKNFYYKYIKRQNPYSLEAVKELLQKFNSNVHFIKGNSNKLLSKIDMSKIDYVFLDGGHEYNTVLNDLSCCSEVINNGGTVLCDDYDLQQAPGVRKAIDQFVKKNDFSCSIICNGRFAKISK